MAALVIKNDGIGDMVLASGIISGLADVYGGVDLVTCAQNQEIAELIPGVRDIYYVSRDALRFGNANAGEAPFDDLLLLNLMDSRYDVAFSLRRYIRQSTLILQRVVNAERKYCFWKYPMEVKREDAERYSEGWEHVVDDVPLTNEADYYARCVRAATGRELDPAPKLKLPPPRERERRSLAMGISSSGRNGWNILKWLKLAELFAEDGYRVRLIGGKELSREVEAYGLGHPSIENLVGDLSLGQLFDLFASSEFYMGSDSGVSHMASLLVPKNVVVVGGGTIPRFFPWPENDRQLVITHAMSCFDCNWFCRYARTLCMDRIHVIDVLPMTRAYFAGELPAGLYNLGRQDVIFKEYASQDRELSIDSLTRPLPNRNSKPSGGPL